MVLDGCCCTLADMTISVSTTMCDSFFDAALAGCTWFKVLPVIDTVT